MKHSEIIELINTSLADEFELDKNDLHAEVRFIEDLQLDSLDYVDMVVTLEQAFGFKLKNKEELKEIRTLQDLYDYISRKYKQESDQEI